MKYFILTLLLSTSAWAQTGDFNSITIFSDSGIRGPAYTEQVNQMQTLSADHEWIQYIHYGNSIADRPLAAMQLQDLAVTPTSLTVITGAIHGNEYLAIADQLVPHWADAQTPSVQAYLASGGVVLVVPILNPDGYAERRRANRNRKDLNRDWPTPGNTLSEPTQPENLALFNYIKAFTNVHNISVNVAVDYHCCGSGMLLLPWGYQRGQYMEPDAQHESDIVEQMFRSSFERYGRIGTPPDLLYSAVGTTLDYWHAEYGAVSFTYEGNYGTEKENLPSHLSWFDKIFNRLTLEP